MSTILQLLDEQGNVVFDFQDPTGAANPNGLKTRIRDGLVLNSPLDGDEVEIFAGESPGGSVVYDMPRLRTMSWRLYPFATSLDNLTAALGEMERLLKKYSMLRWMPKNATQELFVDYDRAVVDSPFSGQSDQFFVTDTPHRHPEGIEIAVMRQPFSKGATIESTPVSVTNNAATGRVLAVEIEGDAPTPVRFHFTATGGTNRKVNLLATLNSDALADAQEYLDALHWRWCSQPGAGGSVGPDTTEIVDAQASGSVALETTFATNQALNERFSISETDPATFPLRAFRGTWRIYLRVRAGSPTSNPHFQFRLRSHFGGAEITHSLIDYRPGSSSEYVDIPVGAIASLLTYAPQQLVLKLDAARVSGGGSLAFDAFSFVPMTGTVGQFTHPTGHVAGQWFSDPEEGIVRHYATSSPDLVGISHTIDGPVPAYFPPGLNVLYVHSGGPTPVDGHFPTTLSVAHDIKYAYEPRYRQ